MLCSAPPLCCRRRQASHRHRNEAARTRAAWAARTLHTQAHAHTVPAPPSFAVLAGISEALVWPPQKHLPSVCLPGVLVACPWFCAFCRAHRCVGRSGRGRIQHTGRQRLAESAALALVPNHYRFRFHHNGGQHAARAINLVANHDFEPPTLLSLASAASRLTGLTTMCGTRGKRRMHCLSSLSVLISSANVVESV